ncbi:aldehyde dehydrogenase [Saprospiraceae bacterium]|nr:aldehyde dehydrogenase [bacterium]MDB4769261.1 aldehyde dehydrogenase [Saprospiraceae bacterium]MDC3209863.1 aldehyde dehydrogenase [Saprospiraceae bacterium]MDG1434399.1 aldehyde dehydrogenase [Saprospiraceae bacterium]
MSPDKYIKNYINGALVPAISGEYFDNYNPAIGQVYSHIPDSDEKDVQLAIEAAERALPEWKKMEPAKRFRILTRIADIIEQNLDEFAKAESIDSGKPFAMARSVDIPRAHQNIRFFATSLLHFSSESHAMPNEAINYTLRQPIGVVGCISPWNLPLYLFTWKIAPALATGNCVIGKPSEMTPMTAYMLSKACIEAGLPEGVLNIIHGFGAKTGQAIVEHPRIKAISFTGGTETGKKIIATAGPMFKKLSLELGGKNPNIIFADCDFDEMMMTTLRSSFSNNGQICLCGSRIYVERAIYEKFRDELVKRTQFLKIGDPFSTVTDLGALVSKAHMEKVMSYLTLAEVEGGTILCGGTPVKMKGENADGYFLRPSVIEGLTQDCRTIQEEIFGPVVTITPFDTEEEVLGFANGTNYGLSATIWTKDISKANRMAENIDAGIVWVNCWMVRDLRTPFGGVKNSGVGREGGLEAMKFFTEPKNVCIKFS